MMALIVGTVLAVAGLAFVLSPVLLGTTVRRRQVGGGAKESGAIDALREIEFDRATGKLSDGDYAALKSSYTERALDELRRAPTGGADVAEAAVAEYRRRRPRCAVHGMRPEADALYCNECGVYLTGVCAGCGATVTNPGARYCTECGAALAA
ncbi:MAG TPA: zinc ribbon domain-containing protein [Gemmatimonadaceae bacterium]|jgi:hypothetical protein|nr:zinc ribbon domain-containing protein [Gemmatimonadaceae bacterium]